jgi:hypothetical protein
MKSKKYTNYILLLLILVLCSFLIYNSQSGFTATPALESYDIIIIAGQSNSIGYGTRNHSTAAFYGANSNIPDDLPSDRIKMYCNDGNIRNASHPFDHLLNWNSKTYRPPKKGATVGNAFNNCNQVGFGLTFSKKYLENRGDPNRKVIVVGCGYGGTGFSGADSDKGFWWKPNDEPNYRFKNGSTGLVKSLDLITRQKITDMSSKISTNSRVVAILWHQGEYDKDYCMSSQTNKDTYISDISRLFTNLRNHIRTLYPTSNPPILIGGLSPELDRKRIDHSFRTDNNSTPTTGMTYFIRTSVVPFLNDATGVGNVHFVSCEPIPSSPYQDYLEGDNELDEKGNPYRGVGAGKIIRQNNSHVHLSASSQRELGKRYAYILNRI